MGVNQVVYGAVSIIDISDSTVTPDTLSEGATAYAANGEKIFGTMQTGMDTTDATATAADMAEGVTAYVNGEKITGTVTVTTDATSFVSDTFRLLRYREDGQFVSYVRFSSPVSSDELLRAGATLYLSSKLDTFGDASPEDVVAGKTFTSTAGIQADGTHVCLDTTDATATAEDIAIGKTAYVDGEKITGTREETCETFHITDADAVLTPTKAGAVTIWGYGQDSTSTYSFAGDGYYSGSDTSKTEAAFSIGTDGKLSGLPDTISALDVLVTIGL